MDDPEARIDELARRARRDREAFVPPDDPPAPEAALTYLREGVGPAVALYVRARTGEDLVRFDPAAFERLEDAMNTWLDLYAACYGAEIDASFTVREAAELLVETHDVRHVAELLTRVPDRRGASGTP
ncbi:MAG: hypothetical protein ABEJ61_06995 [Haloferacaceae archaeon]